MLLQKFMRIRAGLLQVIVRGDIASLPVLTYRTGAMRGLRR